MENTLFSRDTAVSNFKYYYYGKSDNNKQSTYHTNACVEPSFPAAIVFIALFGIATLLHLFQMFKTRTWFMIPFVIGGIFETIGYTGRTVSAHQSPGPYTLGPYIIQAVLILVAPALFAASIYMELARIVHMVEGDRALFIRRTWLTKLFVIGDVFAFLLQASGAGLLSSQNANMINTGNNIIIGGLFAQLLFFGLFLLAAAIFHLRVAKAPTRLCFERPWQKHLVGLYVVSFLILVRSIVRVVEYIQGYSGYIMSHEAFLYVFDAAVMFVAVVSMNWIHPGEVAKYVRELDKGKGSGSRDGIMMSNV